MKRPAYLGSVLSLAVVLLLVGISLVGPAARATATTPVAGSVRGPTVLATGATGHYTIYGTGGPAIAANGTQVGNLTYYVSLAASDLTGVTVAPAQAALGPGLNGTPILTVGTVPETVTMTVMVSSVYLTQNVSTNLTYSVQVVQPYVVSATIVNVAKTTVLAFPVAIYLDGQQVGTVSVGSLTPGGEYNLSYDYATTGLSTGEHTFTISLLAEHGLVVFANGAQSYSQSFYVTGPAPNYALWIVVGAVAFVGVLFIFATRVAARRRGGARR
ncbi:MAG: CARDB domain-containing protein [Thermoplasmata archaeon]|jgi:hypothetical protein